MAKITMIYSNQCETQWLNWLKSCVHGPQEVLWENSLRVQAVNQLQTEALIILCDLNEIGRDEGIDQLVKVWRKQSLRGKTIGLICRTQNDWHTKTYSRSMALIMNDLGAVVLGKALVEILPGYHNFSAWKKSSAMTLEEIAKSRVTDLVERLSKFNTMKVHQPKLLVLHSCVERTSNTLALWRLTESALKLKKPEIQIRECYLARGSITDCIGCDYKTCTDEAQNLSCVVGGQFVEELMPALEWADAIVWLCPNYNDTISADLIAVINRMSGFYRTRDLSRKAVYAVIVSGNSGTDAVANQLLGSLNLNKGYMLPPQFCLSEIASDPLSVLEKSGVRDKAEAFADNMLAHLCE